MGDPEQEDDLIRLGVAAEMARRSRQDQREFAEDLAPTLQAMLPGHAEAEYAGGLFGGRRLSSIRVPLGDHVYRLDVPAKGPLAATVEKHVRGIKLKSEKVTVEEWVARLSEELDALAEADVNASSALKRLLGGQNDVS